MFFLFKILEFEVNIILVIYIISSMKALNYMEKIKMPIYREGN